MLFRVLWSWIFIGLIGQVAVASEFPETVVFPSLVSPQALEQVEKIPELSDEQLQAVDFVVHEPSKKQIKMPLHGEFKLIFEAGESFRIFDHDATDGEARIQLPIGSVDIFLRVAAEQASSTEASFIVEDALYYVHQELKLSSLAHWHKLPGRPIPVLADWHSGDGSQYVLSMMNSGISQVSMRWISASLATFPVGMVQIGPEGGLLVLPGVAEVEIPANALSELTTISLRQEKEIFPGTVMLSPIVRFEPFGLSLKEPAQIRMVINKTLLGQNHPVFANYSYFDPSDEKGYVWKGATSTENIRDINLDSWVQLPILTKVFVSMPEALIDRDFQPYMGSGFTTQQTLKCHNKPCVFSRGL